MIAWREGELQRQWLEAAKVVAWRGIPVQANAQRRLAQHDAIGIAQSERHRSFGILARRALYPAGVVARGGRHGDDHAVGVEQLDPRRVPGSPLRLPASPSGRERLVSAPRSRWIAPARNVEDTRRRRAPR